MDITAVVVGDSFNITTPNYPYFYPRNIECTWTFTSLESGGSFAIHFLEFDTQRENDPVTIGKGEVVSYDNALYQLTGTVPSHVVLVMEVPAMWVIFQSDIIGTFTGMNLVIERIEETGRCIVEYKIMKL